MSCMSRLKSLNSEAVLKDFSINIKKEMINHALNYKIDLTSDMDRIIKEINSLEEKDLLALYIEGHSYDEDAIDCLVQAQDDKLPF